MSVKTLGLLAVASSIIVAFYSYKLNSTWDARLTTFGQFMITISVCLFIMVLGRKSYVVEDPQKKMILAFVIVYSVTCAIGIVFMPRLFYWSTYPGQRLASTQLYAFACLLVLWLAFVAVAISSEKKM